MLAAGPSHGHDGSAAVFHGRLHVAEVEVYSSVRVHCDQFRDTFHGIAQDVVGSFERLFHRDVRVTIHVAESFVVHDEQRIHVLPQFVDAFQCLYDFSFFLEIEGDGNHAHRQQSHLLGNTSHHWGSSCSGSTPHSRSHEHHLGAVAEQPFQFFDVRFRLRASHLGFVTGPQTGPQLQFHGHLYFRELLAIGVACRKRHTLDTLVVHVVHRIATAAAHTNHFDDMLHLVFGDIEKRNQFAVVYYFFLHNAIYKILVLIDVIMSS